MPTVVGGRYGLSSKEFTPAMVKGIFDEIKKTVPKNHFTIGIVDDISHSSLDYDDNFSTEDPKTVRALFYGLGSDGTVGANKNSIKIIGNETPNYAQGYFVYDSKKSGSMTTSHLRFGPKPIRSSYLITRASFIACHNFSFLEKMDVLEAAMPGATFLLNSPYSAQEHPADNDHQEDRVLRHRRLQGGSRCRHGHAHQHHHADLLLRHQRRAAPR
jgi:pyruvate-ferredoxin/flavodoxin oxidoreductase